MDLICASKMGIVNDRKIVKCLNHLLRMMCRSRSIAKPWTMMARGLVIWNCKQLLLLHGVTFAFIRSYHDEEHYNSVRLKEDTRDGPARPITIKADSNLSSSSCQAIAGSNKSKSGAGKDITDAGSIKLVMAGCGCENIEKVEQTLLQMDGDVDAAIEYLIAEQGIEDFAEETVWSPCNTDASHGDDANGNSEEQRKEPVEETYKENPPGSSAKRNHDGGSAQREDKEMQKIPRNEACPCGSKKKYRSCCGSGTGKISAISNDQALESRKSRKEKKRGKRGSDTSALSIGSDGGPPDVGALCI
ncbi:OVARIAN TUMOR DOMAIN-containing deubiquitinating enzyme 7-like isoform X4 [Eucalyptus grandis]|uniref:OVARIAN TUMOR DOMAIN-containing deubiquitinating enzyme 7-like isoform X4 n=1 Tax=Eucalyptus grandis TaxID=71139 RepID=UPI00192ECA27|nr:OVARIAN TUMOR DOMAIN-containing deubiquitinating enzyme 7-like isoform X4 [Eucalyptus grandis]